MYTKTFAISQVCVGMLTTVSLWGNTTQINTTLKNPVSYMLEVTNPHHFYMGPEVFDYQLRAHVGKVKVSGSRPFVGSRIGYEYLMPKSFYAGIDWLCAHSTKDYKASVPSWFHANRHFGNIDFRVGYSWAPRNWIVSPFFGIGGYSLRPVDHHNHQGLKEAFGYLSVGAHSLFTSSSYFNIGVNARLNWLEGEQDFQYPGVKLTRHQHSVWGGELAVPMIWNLGSSREWNIRFEPYILSLNFAQLQNVYGTRLFAGYRF